ncbi:MAG TPA: S-methyl-5-thioribose-1-phosphate isomerase [Chloroflexi bacterium]|jgi:methylthioribose-1-phosphate isomerase|nr:S-methyl-5-thioribose-1-phosphate isomerase [Chloroflexota bacterium]
MKVNGVDYRTVWMQGSTVRMIDQQRLPHEFVIVSLPTHQHTAEAIRAMVVRGAGAIGAAAGYGMAQVVLEAPAGTDYATYIARGAETLRRTRPTAQDLFYAVNRVLAAAQAAGSVDAARRAAVAEAEALADANAAAGEAIGRHGADLISDGARVLTHCNAGWLAFVDWGSALAPIYAAARQGKRVFVYADETRPRCQGAMLTAWELAGEGIDHAIIADNAAGYLMHRGEVDLVIVGSDRIAANGDVANKIGTYEKALCAAANDVPFYVAAPTSTIDPACPTGDDIPIEERSEDEVLYISGKTDAGEICRVRIAPEGARARNPAFDVTPARYVRAIITEYGVHAPNALPRPR